VIKSRRRMWAGHAACMGEGRGLPSSLSPWQGTALCSSWWRNWHGLLLTEKGFSGHPFMSSCDEIHVQKPWTCPIIQCNQCLKWGRMQWYIVTSFLVDLKSYDLFVQNSTGHLFISFQAQNVITH
jgi:hypothetical protein